MSIADQIRKGFSKWLSLPNHDTVDIVAATYLANQLPGKAVWLAIVGPPATGKTEIAQALTGCLRVHSKDGISTSTFVSGYRTSKASTKKFGLLEQMQDGLPHMVVIRDFSAILQKRPEQRTEILAQLRSLYDGRFNQTFGNDVTISWEGKMGMIVCSTGQYDKEIKSLAMMGDRFLVFRQKEGNRKGLAERASRNAEFTDKMRIDLEKAYSLLNRIKLPKTVPIDLRARQAIAEVCDFITRARSPVSRDFKTREVDEVPELEGTARVAIEISQIARGLTVYHGKTRFEDSDVELLDSLVFSSVPHTRSLVLSGMDLKGRISGLQLSRDVGVPKTVVSRTLEDLQLLGIINWEPGTMGSKMAGWVVLKEWKPFVFRLTEWMKGGP